MQISDNQYLEKVFKSLRQKLNLLDEKEIPCEKTNVLIGGLFMSTTMKASVHRGPSYNEKFGCVQEPQFRRAQDVVRHHSEIDLGTCIRDAEMFP